MGIKVVPVAVNRATQVYADGESWDIVEEKQGLNYVKIFDDCARLIGQHLAPYVYSVSKIDTEIDAAPTTEPETEGE